METVLIDTTGWNVEWVKSFTTVASFKAFHNGIDWLSPSYLTEVYNLIKNS